MTIAYACPGRDILRRLMLGEFAGPTGDRLAEHLEQCDHCASAVKTLQAEDTLLEAARARVTLANVPEGETVRGLVERLRRLGPPAAEPGGESALMGSAEETQPVAGAPAAPAGREATPEDTYDFLSPSQGPGELGRLGTYRILKVLGGGGMGVVFLAEDVVLQRQVALKVMRPEAARQRKARERFLREARAVAELEHENIVPIYGIGEESGVPFLAMQLLKGMSLEERLKRPGPLSVPQVLRLGRQIARGLQAAHAAGLIHRDIKPANLWIEPDSGGRIKVLDFGLTRPVHDEAHLTQSGMIVGTPSYMAPEQARGEAVDARCDLFSLGVVLYRICTGKLPFRNDSVTAALTSLAADTPAPPQSVNPSLPAPLAELIVQLLAKDPARRPASAGEVAGRLQTLERQLAASGPPVSSQTTDLPALLPARPRRPRRRILLAAAVALLALLPLGYFFGGTVIRFATNKGELVIETDDPNIEVTIKGESAIIYDKVKDRRFVLTAGDYEVEVRGDDMRFTTKRFTITRGGKETLNARLEPARARPPDVKPVVASDERKAAEWVLLLGGKVVIRTADQEQEISASKDLPSGAFHLLQINLSGLPVSDAELVHFKGLANLAALSLHGTQVSDAGLVHLKGLTNLTALDLDGTRVSDAGLVHLKGLTNLTELNLHGTQVSDAGLVHLKGLTNLTALDLDGTRVSDAGLVHLKGLAKLTLLGLGGTQVSDAGLVHLKGLTNLTGLYLLRGTRVSDAGLEHLKALTKLTGLSLEGTRISDAGLVHLKALPNLTTLILQGTQVSDAGLVHLKGLTNFTYLNLNGTRVSDASLAFFLSQAKLQVLDLTGTRLSAKGFADLKAAFPSAELSWSTPTRTAAEAVLALGGTVHVRPDGGGERLVRAAADLPAQYFRVTQVRMAGIGRPLGDLAPKLGALTDPTFDDLRVLDLSGTAATDADLRDHLGKLTKLVELSLAQTQVSDDGLASLAALKQLRRLVLDGTTLRGTGLARLKDLPELVELRLGCPTLTDLGIKPLGELKRLQKLSLAGSGVSDEGLASLSGLDKLQELDLTGTRVTAEGIAALKKALPKCKVLSGPAPK